MGIIKHNALIVTASFYKEALKHFDKVYEKASQLFESAIISQVLQMQYGYKTFLIGPCGSQENFKANQKHIKRILKLEKYIDSFTDSNGCPEGIFYVRVYYSPDYGEAKIEKTNI